MRRDIKRLGGKGQKLWKKAKTLIPGGNQLLSKRAEMFLPDNWPAYYSKAKGVHVWDLDGRKYLDMSIMGIGACMLGYADPDVNAAVSRAVKRGTMATLNAPEEVELAELLCEIHPWAEMVRYARAGGEAMAIAARIARASTGRDVIAFCGYHGWADWYLATNLKDSKGLNDHLLAGLEAKGVPQGLRGSILPFRYNHVEELESIIEDNKGKVAAIIMEPLHGTEPTRGFLEKVRAIADDAGAVLIFDEITMGFRLTGGGAHLLYGIDPDMAIFSKGISNGYPMAAIIGRRNIMQAAQDTFISSTYWTERIGPTAALATIKKLRAKNASKHMKEIGEAVREIWSELGEKHGVDLEIAGLPVLSVLKFLGKDGQALRTLYTQEMLVRGILASHLFYPSLAHTKAHVATYLNAADDAFAVLADAVQKDDVLTRLKGPVAHTGFQRLN